MPVVRANLQARVRDLRVLEFDPAQVRQHAQSAAERANGLLTLAGTGFAPGAFDPDESLVAHVAGYDTAQADAEAVAGVGVGHALDSQPNGAAGVAGHVEVVAATAHGAGHGSLLGVLVVDLFVPAFRIEVIDDELPHAAAHVGQAEAVAALFAVVVHGRDERKAVAPGGLPQRPGLLAARQEIDGGDVQPAFAFLEFVAPPEVEALLAAAAAAVLPLGFRGQAVLQPLRQPARLAFPLGQPSAERVHVVVTHAHHGKDVPVRETPVRVAPALARHRFPRMHHLRRQVIAVPFRIEDLRLAAGLLGIGDVLALRDEAPELPDADFGAAHPEAVLHARQSRLLAFVRLALRPRLGAAFDARGPLLLFRRAAHHELTGREVDDLQRDAAAEVDPSWIRPSSVRRRASRPAARAAVKGGPCDSGRLAA